MDVYIVNTCAGSSLPWYFPTNGSHIENSAVHTALARARMRRRSSRRIGSPSTRPPSDPKVTIPRYSSLSSGVRHKRSGLVCSSSDCRIQNSVDSQSVGNPVLRYYIRIASKRDNLTRARVDSSYSGMVDFVETWMTISKGFREGGVTDWLSLGQLVPHRLKHSPCVTKTTHAQDS